LSLQFTQDRLSAAKCGVTGPIQTGPIQ
jgi:hypothetical protein